MPSSAWGRMFWELIGTIWPILAALFAFVVWNVRLEAKVIYLEKDYADMKERAQEKDKLMWSTFDDIRKTSNAVLVSITRVETKLETIEKKSKQ